MRSGVLHRWLVVPLIAAVLYGGAPALASEAVETFAAPPPALSSPTPLPPPVVRAPPPPAAPAPGPAATPRPAAGITPQPAPNMQRQPLPDAPAGPHFALLLPLGSPAFAKAAEAVRDGFLAAAATVGEAALPVRVYPLGDDPQEAVETYIFALRAGARVAVGPLTRSSVTALAESAAVLVPTLALNVPEGPIQPVPDFYTLSLQAEAEARQMAQLAWQEGRRIALTVSGDTPLLKRIHQAFVEEFTRLGGIHEGESVFSPELAALARLKQAVDEGNSDMVFLALDASRARLVRGYLGALALYATSQVNPGNAAGPLVGYDLAGIRFLDIPWLLRPEDPAMAVFPRPDYRDAVELERLYALGIDAFRIALSLLRGKPEAQLDGMTGRLTLGSDRQFVRSLTLAQFSDGRVTVVRGNP